MTTTTMRFTRGQKVTWRKKNGGTQDCIFVQYLSRDAERARIWFAAKGLTYDVLVLTERLTERENKGEE